MKRTFYSSAALVFAAAACTDAPVPTEPVSPATAAASAAAGEIIPGRFIVTLREGAAPAAVARDHGVAPEYTYTRVLNGFAGSISEAARSGLLRDARVARIEPDGIARAIATQTPATWGLDRVDQRSLPLNNTYVYNATGSGVTAYILDTGILFGHSEFGGRAISGYDGFGGNGTDCNGHGTHVAGTVGGATYGVAKSVTLVAVRVLDCGGSGTWGGVIAGMDWVAGNAVGRLAVANMSLGGGANSSVDDALRRMIAAGVQTAVAAGNGNMGGREQDACNYSPARTAEAITIGATTSSDSKTSWSNYGNCVDFFAPGSSITSAWYTSNTATHTISGTSMAAPHVAGAAALYLGLNPSASPQQVRDALYALTTKSIVLNSRTANNHLLYVGELAAPSQDPVATSVTAASAISQSAEAGTAVSDPPSVLVKDQFDNPIGGVTVTFAVTAGGGAIAPTSVATGSNGIATASSWTLGSEGANSATATVSGVGTVTFNATATTTSPPPAGPSASFTFSCGNTLTCSFDASGSTGGITSYVWTFSTGDPDQGVTISRTFGARTTNVVTLTVSDGTTQSVAQQTVTCNPKKCQ